MYLIVIYKHNFLTVNIKINQRIGDKSVSDGLLVIVQLYNYVHSHKIYDYCKHADYYHVIWQNIKNIFKISYSSHFSI